jgi:amidohydrolase
MALQMKKPRLSSPRKVLLVFLACFSLLTLPAVLGAVDAKTAQKIEEEIEKNKPEIIKIRRFLHMNPELSNREFETSRLVGAKLETLGLVVRNGIAKTGVVALLRGAQPGACVAVRADMDALPIQETTNVPFRSLNPGVMHACGHDVHTSIVLGTAMVLNALKDKIRGSVTFIFQPAEEGPPEGEEGGAQLMLREGVLDNPPPSAIFGLHVWPEADFGQVLFAPGFITASSDGFRITIKGKSAHAARPEEGIDAIVIASEIVQALQTVVSRAVDPTDPAVVTIGTIEGGSRANIIAEKVILEGTVRALSEANRKKIPPLMEAIVKNIAGIYGAAYEFEYKPLLPSVYNNPELAATMAPTLAKLLGKDKVLEWKPQMIAEDFSFFARKVPGFYFFLGVRSPGQPAAAPLHSPNFNPDERSIPLGIRILSHLLLDALEEQSSLVAGPTGI